LSAVATQIGKLRKARGEIYFTLNQTIERGRPPDQGEAFGNSLKSVLEMLILRNPRKEVLQAPDSDGLVSRGAWA
jgi:hypothetical protein